MSRFPIPRSLPTLLLALLLSACTATIETPVGGPVADDARLQQQINAANQSAAEGDFEHALAIYDRLIAARPFSQANDFRLLRIETLILAAEVATAEAELARLATQPLTPSQALHHQILTARLLIERDPDAVLALLQHPAAEEGAIDDTSLLEQLYLLRSSAFAAVGNHLEAARAAILREFYLLDRERIASNQFTIWQSLSQLSRQTLQRLQVEPPPDLLSGWLELAQLVRDNSLTQRSLTEQLNRWRARYPNHPLLAEVEQQLLERNQAIVEAPRQVALLLPFSGRFAKPAEAIRDAILAASYREPNAPTIRLYDTGAAGVAITTLYDRAVAEGAEFVIGPLNKEALTELAQRESLPVTTLALNSFELAGPENLFQFSLSPEDEAASAAERAWAEGHRRAAMLVPTTDLGRRIADSFSANWSALGGSITAIEEYDQKQSDYSRSITRLLHIDDSNQRKQQIASLLREPLEFTPRIRQDIDFIFLMAHASQGRLLRPQLRFHHASRLPVFATSHIYSGQLDINRDRDLDGIQFSDMPWTLHTAATRQQLASDDNEALARYQGGMQRLVAFGLDAYALVRELRLLALYPNDSFQGSTGTLTLPGERRISRRLDWALFQGGKPRPLPRMEIADDRPMEMAPEQPPPETGGAR